MKPLVSIGVPTYNRPEMLERTLQSLLGQTYENIEIIVSDNCSTNSQVEAVMSRFIADKRIKYFRQPVNKGAIFNFNFLLEKFSGSYVMRLGDDDWVEPNYIECCVEFLEQNPGYVGAYGQTRLYDVGGKFVKYDPAINMDQDSYRERMVYYLENVNQNGCYFGLIRANNMQCVFVCKKLADDWLGIARLSFGGKIKMLDNTSLNLSQGGAGNSMENIVKALGGSRFNEYFPHLTIALNVYADILWNSPVYKKIGFIKRQSLALVCAETVYRRFNVKNEIKWAYRGFLKASFFPGILKRHAN
ncbi:MAG: glycosyltransferase family 2 protein [Chitinophagaceae bacterium]